MDSKIIQYFKEHGYYPFNQLDIWAGELLFSYSSNTIVDTYDIEEDKQDYTIKFAMFGCIGRYVVACTDKNKKIKWCYSFIDFQFATEFYHNNDNIRSLYHKHIGG